MAELQIITPAGMFGSEAGEHPIITAMRVIGVGFGEKGDWNAKYGADFENDVFMMKPYCWCERDDCPWCAGCGAFEDACLACGQHPHKPQCFSEVTHERRKAWDAAHPKAGFDREMKAHREINAAERKARGLPQDPYQWFCDCGAEQALKADRDLRGCDYHRGTGMFSRFAPWTFDRERHYYDPPNFWFKPDNFRLTWYKYIGRDMSSNKDSIAPDFLDQIFATHPRGMTAVEAITETARQEEETSTGFAKMFERLGINR